MHAKSYLTLCLPLNCNPTIPLCIQDFQAKILECVAISSSRGSSPQKHQTLISRVSCTAGRYFTANPSYYIIPYYLKFSPCHSLTMNLPLFSLLNVFLPCPLEKEMATHASMLAWMIPWTKEPGRPWGGKKVRYDLVAKQRQRHN